MGERSNDVHLRVAVPADAATLARLNHHVHDLHVAAEPEHYRPTDDAEVAERFAALIDGGRKVIVLAELDGAAVGYVVAQFIDTEVNAFAPVRRFALVDQLAVAPEVRRTGTGRALMQAAEDEARARGYPSLVLDVRAHNEDARVFYEALGFEVRGLRLGKRL